jgi:hypothetical protein
MIVAFDTTVAFVISLGSSGVSACVLFIYLFICSSFNNAFSITQAM